jgi:hypothetical protein
MPRALPGGGYEFGGVVTDSLGRYLHQLWATEPLEACFAVVVTREPAGRDTVALSHRMLLRADPDTLTVDVTLP